MSRARMGNNLDTIRRHNLSAILTLVHQARSLPRTELTRLTGLNRSTIAGLVGELQDLGLVGEVGAENTTQVGRPSSIVKPASQPVAIAVNPEIDAITVGVVSLGGVVQNKIRFATDDAPTVRQAVNITAAIVEGVRGGLQASTRIVGIGVAVPGLVRLQDGLVRYAPHLGWRDEPLAEMLAAATGLDTWAANDAGLGALAERTFGAGKGIDDLIYLNGGASGVGGGVIAGGVALRGASGYAGELGHTRVRGDGLRDSAGARGTLESEVRRENLLNVLALPPSADEQELERALLASDSPAVRAEANRQLDFLGVALGSAINSFNPRLVVLGGFLGALYEFDSHRLNTVIEGEALPEAFADVAVTRPALNADILIVGAAELAFAPLLSAPAEVMGTAGPSRTGGLRA
ncbi:ROK family protein [Pseudarthrobacter sp. NamB4]|nr:ROK family protein [Pseudarthrobacter sp. NamB4]